MERALAAFASEPVTAGVFLVILALFMSLPATIPMIISRLQRSSIQRARKNFNLPVVEGSAIPQDVRAIEQEMQTALDNEDWGYLGQRIGKLADTPEDASDGRRTYDVAIEFVLRPLDEAQTDPELKHALVPFRDAMRRMPHVPGLIGLYLRGLQKAAWRARGTYEGREPDEEGMRLFHVWMKEIEQIVFDTGRAPARSILLAEPFYHAAFIAEDPFEALDHRFEMILSADNGNLRLWAERSHHLLPGWYGSIEAIGDHMDRAARMTGESVVPLISIAVLPCIGLHRIDGWSESRFLAAVSDLALRNDGQETVNALCSTLFLLGYGRLSCEVARRHLRVLHMPAWDSEDSYLLFFDTAFGGRPLDIPRPVRSRPISQMPAE